MSTGSFTFGTTVSLSVADAREKIISLLKPQGFGILTEIDVAATMKKKVDKDMKPYVILGACNPKLAARAFDANPKIGALLPCNVIVYEDQDGKTVVEAMDPDIMSKVDGSDDLKKIAGEAKELLARALEGLN
eukprot:m.25744 g.25744  ORF g.25744 m.25744 type:complete len:133 (+) comp9203_c0_seq1:175-573(+)